MRKIGFTCSSFDLLHAGHIAMLRESKENCDWLIVGLNVNPVNKDCMQSWLFYTSDAADYALRGALTLRLYVSRTLDKL